MKRRMPKVLGIALKMCFGTCPACSLDGLMQMPSGVIYRRSRRSVTMRCSTCGLQWTMTWAMINKAAKRHVQNAIGDELALKASMYGTLVEATGFAVERETRGRRGEQPAL